MKDRNRVSSGSSDVANAAQVKRALSGDIAPASTTTSTETVIGTIFRSGVDLTILTGLGIVTAGTLDAVAHDVPTVALPGAVEVTEWIVLDEFQGWLGAQVVGPNFVSVEKPAPIAGEDAFPPPTLKCLKTGLYLSDRFSPMQPMLFQEGQEFTSWQGKAIFVVDAGWVFA